MRGKAPTSQFVPYVLSQLVGSVLASLSVYLIQGQTFTIAPGLEVTSLEAVIVEVLFTFALALVVLNVATHPKVANNSFYGLAIGFTVMAGAASGGPISGGAFNPAVGTGPILIDAMVGGGSAGNLWIYWVGPLIGGALASVVYGIQEK
jgi:aquaporin Z